MPILPFKKFSAIKTAIRNLPYAAGKESRSRNYDGYVKISEHFDKDTFEYLEGLKSTIGNYAKHNRLEVTMSKPLNGSKEVQIDVFAKEHPVLAKFYDLMEMAHDTPLKLNEEKILIKVNPHDKDEVIAPSRKIFAAISETVKNIEKMLNQNLK